ncbi:MAG: phosphoglucosamine mutase [Acidimicrobiales bacterium]|nr:phosphoglucosamine mutase [Acidimicrobiales bacterium]
MTLKFGTDGVRGHADELSDDLVYALGRAAVRVLGGTRMAIGMDTRESGPRIQHALRLGVEAEGVVVDFLGVVPTPAVAFFAARERVPGAMISASHNPYYDNGIKFFVAGGLKLSDETESRLEEELARILPAATDRDPTRDDGDQPDRCRIEQYEQALIDSIGGRRLDGLRVVIDCANGAASMLAPEVLRSLGADVVAIHASPDGRNINEACGSTDPRDLQAAVTRYGAEVGLAFDGDADRVIAVDEHGELVDGDQIIAMCAVDRKSRGLLPGPAVVVTVMSNLGFRLAMREHGIEVIETNVGDRYVLEALEQRDLILGGEQSGHIIFRDLATTGDGLLTGVQVLDLLVRRQKPLSELASVMTKFPQVLKNVAVALPDHDVLRAIADLVADEEAKLGDFGRVLVRPSGTEPLVRVMVEAKDFVAAEAAAKRLADAVSAVCGAARS